MKLSRGAFFGFESFLLEWDHSGWAQVAHGGSAIVASIPRGHLPDVCTRVPLLQVRARPAPPHARSRFAFPHVDIPSPVGGAPLVVRRWW